MKSRDEWTDATVGVGAGGGRGFVVAAKHARYVLTAGHCLPKLPPSNGASYLHERTYRKILGPLGGRKVVWAECLFVDPIADIAVLGSPDDQELCDEAEAFESLLEGRTPLRIGRVPLAPQYAELSGGDRVVLAPEWTGRLWMLSLDKEWFACTVVVNDRFLWIESADQDIRGGMSGSAIVSDDGTAVGMVCLSGGAPDIGHRSGGPNPYLCGDLPTWLLTKLAKRKIKQ